VLSGEVQLYDGTGWRTGRPGDFLFVPEGGLHGFRGADHASMLLLFTPGGPREDYFETLADGAPMSEEERVEFMLRHDTYWV
jgi:quercetin dioxygenase-like cupin family protein